MFHPVRRLRQGVNEGAQVVSTQEHGHKVNAVRRRKPVVNREQIRFMLHSGTPPHC